MTAYSNTRVVFSVFSQPTNMNKHDMSTAILKYHEHSKVNEPVIFTNLAEKFHKPLIIRGLLEGVKLQCFTHVLLHYGAGQKMNKCTCTMV